MYIALGSVMQKYKTYPDMSYSKYTKLFNTCVAPVIDYGSSIWGFKGQGKIDSVQCKAERIFLGVHRLAPIAGVEGDMDWIQASHRRHLDMLRSFKWE